MQRLISTVLSLLLLSAATWSAPQTEPLPPHLALAGLSPGHVREAVREAGPAAAFDYTPGTCSSYSWTLDSNNPGCPWQVVVTRKPFEFPINWFCEDGCDGYFKVTVLNEFIQEVDSWHVLFTDQNCAQSHFGGTITCPNGVDGPTWSILCTECDES